jgi:hypothetical protein
MTDLRIQYEQETGNKTMNSTLYYHGAFFTKEYVEWLEEALRTTITHRDNVLKELKTQAMEVNRLRGLIEIDKPKEIKCRWCGKKIYKGSMNGCWFHVSPHFTKCDLKSEYSKEAEPEPEETAIDELEVLRRTLEKLYNKHTINGEREMTLERFKEAVNEIKPIDWEKVEKEFYGSLTYRDPTGTTVISKPPRTVFEFIKKQIEGDNA